MESSAGSSPRADGLGCRERHVLAASARGLRVGDVAAELGLTDQKVRASLASAISKLGARSKLEAVLIALRRGEIDP